MSTRYLIHFVHEHVGFRLAEILSLSISHGCKFRWVTNRELVERWPYIVIELDNGTSVHSLIKTVKSSFLIKGLFELWANSSSSVDCLADEIEKSTNYTGWRRDFSKPEESFRIDVESFGTKLSQATKVEWIKKMKFLNEFDCRPNLVNPRQTYCIFQITERDPVSHESIPKQYYFGRLLTEGNRGSLKRFNLKQRSFIANTTMDPQLSFIAANAAKVKPNDIVYDPFVGSGGLLVGAAYMGAYVTGADINWPLLHGKSKPSRKGLKVRKANESVLANFIQYDMRNKYLDVIVSDITRCPLHDRFKIDAIISDPPYGIREGSEKVGSRREPKPLKDGQTRYPPKVSYEMKDLYRDLLNLAAKHLTVEGRLVYFLPVPRNSGIPQKNFIPEHPCLNLITYCEQGLTYKTSRLMVVMEKHREPNVSDEVEVPNIIDGLKFRELYFSKT